MELTLKPHTAQPTDRVAVVLSNLIPGFLAVPQIVAACSIFKMIDKDGSGCVDGLELANGLTALFGDALTPSVRKPVGHPSSCSSPITHNAIHHLQGYHSSLNMHAPKCVRYFPSTLSTTYLVAAIFLPLGCVPASQWGKWLCT